MAGGMGQKDKRLSPAPLLFPDVIHDRRVIDLKLGLVTQPFKKALGGVALFAGSVQIVLKPLRNEVGEPVQLGPLDLRLSLITGRDRKHHLLLLHARTRDPQLAGGLPCEQKGPRLQHSTLPAARLSRHFSGQLSHCRSHDTMSFFL